MQIVKCGQYQSCIKPLTFGYKLILFLCLICVQGPRTQQKTQKRGGQERSGEKSKEGPWSPQYRSFQRGGSQRSRAEETEGDVQIIINDDKIEMYLIV